MEDKKKIMPKCGFGCVHTYQGDTDFDEYYIERTVTQVVKKTGDGEHDFTLIEKPIEKKVRIKDIIEASSGDAGLEAYLAPYIKTGEQLPGVQFDDNVTDVTNMPEDLAGAIELGDKAKAIFDNLDPKLKGDAKSVEDFLNGLTPDKIAAYVSSYIPKEEAKDEKKVEEEK